MSDFSTVRTVGGLIPPGLLSRIISGDQHLSGLAPSDYHLSSESPREAANRAWSYLTGVWSTFKTGLEKLQQGDPAVGLTREKWLLQLLRELDYGRVPTTPAGGLQIGDRAFPVSHLWGSTPLHLLGWGVELDKRTKGVAGAAERAPHAMVQEALNRTDDYLYAIVSNGRVLRLLRDSTSLSGQSYVEFDLEAIFDGEVFSDFVLLYLLLHQSRVEVRSAEGAASDCWLEAWRSTSITSGTRALTLLRGGVEEAIESLGTGFLQHPANTELRRRLDGKEARLEDLHHALLRLVYRLLFLFVAEDRDALFDLRADPAARQRYADYFSTARLRRLALRRRGTKHTDLWAALTLVITALGDEHGQPSLGLPGIGGLYDPHEADALLMDARLPNDALLKAVRNLSVVQPKGQPKQSVDYRNLGAEELGSIYESLLELVPRYNAIEQTLTLEALAGNDRKTTGSYYTPSSLIDLVLDEALDPLLDQAERSADPETALLAMTVCDPACGSGHFLVAAARRIGERLAVVRTGETDLTPTDIRDALHDVVATCIYGVDLNPLAAELAKVSLWLEAMTPGRPLSLLDAHIKVGNALFGTTPALLSQGIPDDAYFALTDDDKRIATALKKQNKLERDAGQDSLFGVAETFVRNADLRAALSKTSVQGSGSLADLHESKRRYVAYLASPELARERLRADAWCAAFIQPRTEVDVPITTSTLRAIEDGRADDPTTDAVRHLAAEYRFFHWWLEFPEIFEACPATGTRASGWRGGFTAMLGNPPWDQVQMNPAEYFASVDPQISAANNVVARDELIDVLRVESPAVFEEFRRANRLTEATKHYLRNSGTYPRTSVGRLNLYSLFLERMLDACDPEGRCGVVVPTGVLVDAFNAKLAESLLQYGRLRSFIDFENEDKIFPEVHNAQRFCVLATGPERSLDEAPVRLSFGSRSVARGKAQAFPGETQALLKTNPDTNTLPVFRDARSARITLAAYEQFPTLAPSPAWGGPWNLRCHLMFMKNTVAPFFVANRNDGMALYEGKMLGQFDHRFATFAGASPAQLAKGTLPKFSDEQHEDAALESEPQYFVRTTMVESKFSAYEWTRAWLLGWRDTARAVDVRTFICSTFPQAAATGIWIAYPRAPVDGPLLQAMFNSYIFDFIVRQKTVGAHVNLTVVAQLPVPGRDVFSGQLIGVTTQALREWVTPRVLELTYTSWRMAAYANDCLGLDPDADPGPPFRWNPERRRALQAELDAAMFHVYGLDRDEVEHVMDSFAVVRKYDERDHGEFRTKRIILETYDAMARAAAHESVYDSPLDPAPGAGPRHTV